jgi:sortase A
MRDALHTSSGSGAFARLIAGAEWLFVFAGAVLLAWCAIEIASRQVTQYFAHESLVTMPRVAPAPRGGAAVREAPPAGTPLADLSIPRVNLSAVVLQGSDARTLSVGAGHVENTAFPGESGNVAIAGHRDSFFRPLRHVRVGDDVLLETPRGRVRYQVTSLRVVPPTDVSVLEPTPDATLTLVTCYPFWVFGHAPDRFIVRAARVPDGAAAPVSVAARSRAPETTSALPLTPLPRLPDAKRLGTVKGLNAVDDDLLVRQAIERFRAVYNARFSRVGQEPLGGPLTFTGCRIAIEGERAAATCQTGQPASDDIGGDARTFSFAKINGVWAIKSFAVS